MKDKKQTLNPYNRVIIPNKIKENALKIYDNFKNDNKINVKNVIKQVQKESLNMEAKNMIINVLQKIDMHGYYTNISWIFNTTNYKLKQLYRYLHNYWSYKAGLTSDLKNKMYPNDGNNNGDPFYDTNLYSTSSNKYKTMISLCTTINRIIDSSNDNSIKNMGCMITLMAINDINNECGQYNTWLLN